MIRPYGLASFMALLAGKKEWPSSMVVLLLSARSADPPQNSGRTAAIALITFPEAARVAISLSDGKTGRALAQSDGSSLLTSRLSSAARSGFAALQVANSDSHATRAVFPLTRI